MEQQLKRPVVRHEKRFRLYNAKTSGFKPVTAPHEAPKPSYKTYPIDSYVSYIAEKDKARMILMERLFKSLLAPIGSKRNPL